MNVDDILQIFFDEADDHLSKLEDLFLQLNPDFPDDSNINAILRAAHSLKGNSATVGLDSIAKVAHEMESLLDDVRKHYKVINQEAVDVLLEAKDNINNQIRIYKSGEDVELAAIEPIVKRIVSARNNMPRPGDVESDMIMPDLPKVQEHKEHDSAKEKLEARLKNFDQVLQIIFILDVNIFPVENVFSAIQEYGSFKLVDKKVPKKQKPGKEEILFHIMLHTHAAIDEVKETLIFVVEDEENLMIDASPGEDGTDFGLFDMVFEPLPVDSISELDKLANELANFDMNIDNNQNNVDDDPWGMDHLANKESEKSKNLALNNKSELSDNAEQLKLTTGPTTMLDHPMANIKTDTKKTQSALSRNIEPGTEIKGMPAESRLYQRAADRKEAAADAVSLRVNLNKVEQVVDLVGELVISQNQLMLATEALDSVQNGLLIEALNSVANQTKALQESVLSIRMTPVSSVFNRYYRMVRELNNKLKKDVVLKVMGENTEIDKILAEKIVDPIAHLIRNSMDHGIENGDFREAVGKSRQGYILLRAFHRANTVVIELMDDGAGLNKDKILKKADERGLLKKSVDSMTDSDIWNLIFEPGFSTADNVSEVSGRGVGMDVVKQNIAELGGRVEIHSALGKGTKISLILPLTLSILDGMAFDASGQSFIIPVSSVIRTMVPDMKYIKTVKGFGTVIDFDGEFIPVERLSTIFELPTSDTEYETGVWLILDASDNRIAIWVDKLEGQTQVVLKSLNKNYKSTPGIFGATIKKDGDVALIVEAADVVDMAGDLRAQQWRFGKSTT